MGLYHQDQKTEEIKISGLGVETWTSELEYHMIILKSVKFNGSFHI